MERIRPTTPFGRRPLSLGMVAAQASARACSDDAAAQKWQVFRDITEAKAKLGLSDRALAVLGALLSFHPETVLTPSPDLVVFPSNRELALRAHGAAPATLRRALAHLVEAGIVIRRDSPNGKRYARRGEGGQIEQAFGFDLAPLITRAAEFARLADSVRADMKAWRLLREEISLHRRDIAKTFAITAENSLPGPWGDLLDRFQQLGSMPPRSASRDLLEQIAGELRALRLEVDKWLVAATESENLHANESQNGRHHQNTKPDPILESEPGFRRSPGQRGEPDHNPKRPPSKLYPLGLVLEACPDIVPFARWGISSWREFLATASFVRLNLGISPSAWEDAVAAMGEEGAAITVAAILQRGEAIKSPGGYLRNLTERARAGQFSLGPVLMALLRVKVGTTQKRA